jgi:hypothetical protein
MSDGSCRHTARGGYVAPCGHRGSGRFLAVRCGANGATMDIFCTNLALGPGHHSLFYEDQWHLVYCFADATHADFSRERFGGKTFHPEARGRGRDWHLLHDRSVDRKR